MVSFALHFNERVEPEEIDHKKIQRALKAKDDGDVSDSAYHELKMVAGSSLPSLYGIQKERKAQNAIIPITEFEGNAKGCSRSIKDILSYSSDVIGNAGGNVITLRFSGDGRKTTKKLGSVMTTFCFPAENSVKRSPEREYCISIYDGKESYDILKATLRGVFDEMKALGRTGILVNGLEYTIDWVMCADWKFMACILGINSPCALYFCIWCECSKRMIRDFSIPQWPITRTLNQCRARVGCPNAKGVQCLPLVDIEFTKVIPDTLHLKLRIMGKLLNQVACWAIEQNVKKAMEEAIEALGVRFCFYDVQDDSGKTTTKWSSLDCDGLETIIRGLDIHAFLGDMENKSITSLDCLTKAQLVEECRKFHLRSTGTKDFLRATLKDHLDRNNIVFEPSSTPTCEKTVLSISELTQVWKSLMVLTDALGANPGDEAYLRADAFQEKARQWGTKFRKATFDEDVIPYIHVLVYHVPQFLEIHGTIHQFNCQTVEKKNHMQNKTFHRGSQKGGKNSNYTVQSRVILGCTKLELIEQCMSNQPQFLILGAKNGKLFSCYLTTVGVPSIHG
ncbi:uncharacterized protein LOC125556804 isoform X1 [Nematostella vectensis]|uniref:uncharacterized protein LOC116603471 isoform X1 n=1 Tax=Nematostella vectensis TaxID=45351 RepID=UPI00207774AA|nr:uncharacterized protein LOC116603471 isoform X1 [Nematostella vectensis]XP_048580471.1 uncharacterized protein LOC125561144 isoform X1 [Nematostella vectensis]XP_048580817.1 uncharacterized protein LOC125561194 isoform X1 [Nematostella vectensis]XP_048583469.1 uncharacterized protein LOC125563000 isoform X1 [Nematostella vectensis]XP_048588040.1 uncharacterized protein LOC125556804 isoform X1 [Nematostella vectensis]